MKVHVGAVEKRVAFRQHRDGAAGFEMRRDILSRAVEEASDRTAIVLMRAFDLGGDGVEQRELDRVGPDVGVDNAARIAGVALFREVRNDIGLGQHTHGFQRQQFGIAGAGADTEQTGSCVAAHRPGLASALIAAAVMAEPPSRPRTIAQGTP